MYWLLQSCKVLTVMYKKNNDKVRIIQSREEQKRVLEMCHSDLSSGHYEVQKTFNGVRERFHWKGVFKMPKKWFVHIHSFIRMLFSMVWMLASLIPIHTGEQVPTLPDDEQESKHSQAKALPGPCEVSLVSFEKWLITPYSPPSACWNKHALTVLDCFTWFVWVKALPTKESSVVVQALHKASNFDTCICSLPESCLFLQLFFMFGMPHWPGKGVPQLTELTNNDCTRHLALAHHRLPPTSQWMKGGNKHWRIRLSSSLMESLRSGTNSCQKLYTATTQLYRRNVKSNTSHCHWCSCTGIIVFCFCIIISSILL